MDLVKRLIRIERDLRDLRLRPFPDAPAPLQPDDLIWRDEFLDNHISGPRYTNKFGLSEVASGILSWNPITSNGGWFEFVTKSYNTMQSLTLITPPVEHEGDPPQGFAIVYARTRWNSFGGLLLGIRLRWDFTGPLTIEWMGPSGPTVLETGGFEPEPEQEYTLAFGAQDGHLYGAVLTTQPDLVVDDDDVLESVEHDLPPSDHNVWKVDANVGVFVGQYPPQWVMTSYSVWRF